MAACPGPPSLWAAVMADGVRGGQHWLMPDESGTGKYNMVMAPGGGAKHGGQKLLVVSGQETEHEKSRGIAHGIEGKCDNIEGASMAASWQVRQHRALA